MKIKNSLKKFQLSLIKRDIIHIFWSSFSILLLSFLLMILSESIFYFSTTTRLLIFRLLLIISLLIILILIVVTFKIKKNRIKKYSWTGIASLIGKESFIKKDIVLNALQLEISYHNSSSKGLSGSFIDKVQKSLKKLNHKIIFPINIRWKLLTLFLLIIINLGLVINKNISGASIYRWANPSLAFEAPKPFMLASSTGDIHLLGGDSTKISIVSSTNNLDSVFLKLTPSFSVNNDSLKSKTQILKSLKDSLGNFDFKIEHIYKDYTYNAFVKANYFWQAWEEVSSPKYNILVTDRPLIQSFSLMLIPPKYSGLEPVLQSENQARVQGLKGSKININFLSNRKLEKSFLIINEESYPLQVNGKRVEGNFILSENGVFTIHLLDEREISNRNPIPYHLEIIQDLYFVILFF